MAKQAATQDDKSLKVQGRPQVPAKKQVKSPTRGNRTTADDRQDRRRAEREHSEDRALSDQERVDMFRQQFQQAALPDLPKIPGYHVCWLTTTNPRDSIQSRLRLGYELIQLDEIPGWEYLSLKTGDYQGYVGVNEMLAAKIPLDLYHQFLTEVHHNLPMQEEEKLRANIELLKDKAARDKGELEVYEGDEEIGQDERPAEFNDID